MYAADLLTLKASPPAKEEFVDIFQKIKYSLSLLVRVDHKKFNTLKSYVSINSISMKIH